MSPYKIVPLVLLGIIILGLAWIGALYLTRGTPLARVRAIGDRSGPPAITDSQFLRTIEALSHATLTRGNHLELLFNGDQTFPRLWQDLRSATKSITIQMYYYRPGRVADTIAEILIERARAGVRVLLLADAFGAQDIPEAYFDRLRAAGVEVATFRPMRWYKLDKISHRSHIRVIVVDGRIGYTGGFGIDDKWLGGGRTATEWRDTNVRFTGPAVLQLQATFAAGWAEATGVLIVGELFFPPEPFEETDTFAGLLHTAPTIGSTAAERFLAVSIASASKTLYISNAYFVPDDDFRRLLIDAVKRGVDVRVLTAARHRTDVLLTYFAGRTHFDELLEGGVRMYEYQPAMMHAKTFVADGVWSTVGTMNFDNRSLAFNDESNVIAYDPAFAATLEAAFLEDLRHADELTAAEFRARPRLDRVWEWGAVVLSRFL